MAVTINVNGLSLCHKGSGGVSMATVPDVCKTPSPGGPVPIPYPNIAKSSDLAKGTTSVSADGGQMCANYGSEFSLSTGDEPGTVGGVKSSTFKKEASWITYSFDVKLEGKGACRLTDKMFHNHQNTVNAGGMVQSPLAVEEPIDCKAAWEEAERPSKEICKETDPIKRNKSISAAYAKAYKETPHLQWFGAAAFASKQVGCGMASAKDASDDVLPKLTGNDKLADASLKSLGEGNKAVFEEMHPAQEFYKKHGIEGLKHCASERRPPLPDKVLEGFEQADRGNATGDSALVQQGAESMLYQEQHVTLQTAAYDNPLFRQALQTNQEWFEGKGPLSWAARKLGYAQPTRVVFGTGCAPDGAPFFEMSGGNLGDPNWRWDFAKGTTEKFSELATRKPSPVDAALDKIAAGGVP